MDNDLLTERGNTLLQNVEAFLSQKESFLSQNDRYQKIRPFYYKKRQVLENAPIVTKDGTASAYI